LYIHILPRWHADILEVAQNGQEEKTMPNSFAITAATTTIALEGNRQGQASFTVSNTTAHPVRGRAHVVAQPASAAPWLSLQGEAERDFAGTGSQQYIVQLTVPPTAPAGDYTLRLDMVNVADPDDDFSQGPTVKFTVAAPTPVPVKPFPWWIVAVAVGVLIVLGGGTYGLIQIIHNGQVAAEHASATATAQANATATAAAVPTALLSHWQSGTAMTTGRAFLAAVRGPDGRIYAIGGFANGNVTLNTVEVYDPKTNSWSTVASMPTPRAALAAVLGPDGRIYAIGGLANGSAALNTVEVYDPKTNSWSTVAPMPTARYGLAAVLGPDGRIYAIGGYSNRSLNTVEVYDPKTNSWSTVASLSTPRAALAAARGPDGRIYAIGGLNGGSFLNTVEVYDPKANSWSPVASMPTARYGLAAVRGPDGRIYAIGGLNSFNNSGVLATVEVYDPKTNSWSAVAPMPTARWGLAAVLGLDGRIYALGGSQIISISGLTTVETGYGSDWIR
jgi:N-acetylneuraminic acid mutarotase